MTDQTAAPRALPVDTIELRAVLAVLRRQIRVMVYSAAICFGLACLFLAIVAPRYTATALLMVEPTGRDVMRTTETTVPNGSSESARIESEAEILRSSAVGLAVIEALDLLAEPEFQSGTGKFPGLSRFFTSDESGLDADTPVGPVLSRYHDAVTVRRRGLTYLISVEAKSSDPALARTLANTTAQIYIDQQLAAKVETALAGRDILTGQIDAAMARLRATEVSLDDFIAGEFSRTAPSDDPIATTLAEFKALRNQASDQAALADEAKLLVDRADWTGAASVLGDAYLGALADQRSGAAQTTLTLDEIDARLRDRAARQVAALKEDAAQLEQQSAGLRLAMRQALPTDTLSPGQLTALYAIGKEADIAREQYQALLSRMRDLETEAGLQIANARIVSAAVTPDEPTFPNRNVILLLALAASLGLGLSSAFLSEYFIGGITSETQLGDLIGQTPAGAIPFVDEENTGRLTPADRIVDEPLSPYSESFRKLRATIDLSLKSRPLGLEGGSGHVIALTSAQPGEGKTTAALALARTYAVAGRKTLLIDGDLRQPSLHHQIGVAPSSGLGDYLREENPEEGIRDFYARDPATPLALVLGAKPAAQTTDQLLVSSAFNRLLAQARDLYDVVIIDTTPLLPVVDARYILPQADAVVMMVKWAATSQGDLRIAMVPVQQSLAPQTALHPVLSQYRARLGAARYAEYGY